MIKKTEEQLSLFDICQNNHGGHENSEEANKRIQPRKFSLREQIVFHLRFYPKGQTCEQIEQALNVSHQTISARISELKAGGKIRVIGKGKTLNGSAADILGVI